jgi:hypothetical protein
MKYMFIGKPDKFWNIYIGSFILSQLNNQVVAT